jgi:hypothetical protein
MQAGMAEPGESHSAEAPSLAHPGLHRPGPIVLAHAIPPVSTVPVSRDNGGRDQIRRGAVPGASEIGDDPRARSRRPRQRVLRRDRDGHGLAAGLRPLQEAAVAADQLGLRVAGEVLERPVTEILNYKRDGSPFWNGIFIGPVFDEAGEIVYFFASHS